MDANEFMKAGKYLPPIMRDFHDQKDLFKSIFTLYGDAIKNNYSTEKLDWVACHIFTVDYFLWFMAQHGYTLQKSRIRLRFRDYAETISTQMDKWREPFKKMLEKKS